MGAVTGLAWSAALRAVMWEVAGATGPVEGSDPSYFVLLSGAVVGAVLGWAQWRRRSGPVPHRGWVAGTPMLLLTVLLLWNLADPAGGARGGLGLSAVALPVIGVLGGFGLSGGGSRLIRAASLLPLAACVPAWAYTANAVGSPKLSLTTPHGAWVAVLVWALLLTSAIAAGLPHRRSTAPPPAAPAGVHTTTPAAVGEHSLADPRRSPATPSKISTGP